MAQRTLILTGDKRLTKMLNRLAGPKAKAINRQALRKMAKLVLERAKSQVPVQSGAFRRSLTVRAGKRSRRGPRYLVTQRELNRAGSDRKKAFYGAFVELGYRAIGRPRKDGSAKDVDTDIDLNDPFSGREKETRNKSVKTYRKKTFKIRQLRSAKKIPARWIMRQAGKDAEDEALAVYHAELERMITEA